MMMCFCKKSKTQLPQKNFFAAVVKNKKTCRFEEAVF